MLFGSFTVCEWNNWLRSREKSSVRLSRECKKTRLQSSIIVVSGFFTSGNLGYCNEKIPRANRLQNKNKLNYDY